MTASLNVSGLVLRRAEWRDYDRMITLLTSEQGKLEAVVRGCRRPKSELINASEPFVCGQFQLYFAHERYSVTQMKLTDGFFPLRENLDRLTVGAGWLRLLEKVSPENEPAGELLNMSLEALSFLSYTDVDEKLLNLMFQLKLLRLTGFSPATEVCAVCGKKLDENDLYFDAQKGGCVCRGCSQSARKLSYGAGRILKKAPKAPFKNVEMLIPHPDWPEAAEKTAQFVRFAVGDGE